MFEVIGTPEAGSLIVAESLARFRANFQGKIFNENLPAEQWMTSAAELLKEEQSNLENYTAIVLATVNELYEHHKRVEKIWEEIEGKVRSPEERNSLYAPLELEQADAETARRLYRYCFDKKPQGEVEVIKGKYTYIFLLPKANTHALFADGEQDPDFPEIGGFSPKITKGGLNICVVNAGDFAGGTIFHELEHRRNNILGDGRRRALLYLSYGDMPENMRRAIRRRERRSSVGEESAKSEILAYCAELELIELSA